MEAAHWKYVYLRDKSNGIFPKGLTYRVQFEIRERSRAITHGNVNFMPVEDASDKHMIQAEFWKARNFLTQTMLNPLYILKHIVSFR